MTTPPLITGDFGVFKVDYPQYGIVFYVDRMRDNTQLETHGEVTVEMLVNGAMGHLNRARLNFTSESALNSRAKHLKERQPTTPNDAPIPWHNIIEDMALSVLDRHRDGSPSVNLKDTTDESDDQYMMQPLIINEETTLIFGDGGTSKSYLSLAAAMSVATGREFIPGLPPDMTGNPMILDWETSRLQTFRRFQKLAHGLKMSWDEVPDMEYRRCFGRLEDEKYAIKKTMMEKDITLLIVDSISYAAAGDLTEQSIAAATLAPLRWLNATSLCIAHVNKNDSQGKAYGSAFWHNGPRATFEIIREREGEEGRLNVGIFQRKANDDSLIKPLGLALCFSSDKSAAWFERIEIQDVPDLAKGMPLAAQIERLLGHRSPLSETDIAMELDAVQASVKSTLYRGRGTKFIKVAGGKTVRWGNYADPEWSR